MDYKKNSLSSFAREKLLKKIAFFFAVAVFIGAAGTGFWFLRNGEFMKITSVEVSGTRMVPAGDLLTLVKSGEVKREGFMGFILPEDHRLAYEDDEKISGIIKERFPRVKEVSIARNNDTRSISVEVSERKEKIIWCHASAGSSDNERDGFAVNNCFWLDDEGFVIGESPDSEGTLVPVITDKSEREITLGKTIVSAEKLANLIEAEKMMKSFGWVAEETAVEDSSLKEAVMIVSSGQKILVSLERSPWEEGKPILSAIVASGKWPEVEYVDLRIEGKGFYKLR